MPRVKGYRKNDGTIVRGYERGGISLGTFRKRQRPMGALAHLRRSPGMKLDPSIKTWISGKAKQARAPLPKLEGPFRYRSGWEGWYDPSVGRYLSRSDIYMPRNFDPERGR